MYGKVRLVNNDSNASMESRHHPGLDCHAKLWQGTHGLAFGILFNILLNRSHTDLLIRM